MFSYWRTGWESADLFRPMNRDRGGISIQASQPNDRTELQLIGLILRTVSTLRTWSSSIYVDQTALSGAILFAQRAATALSGGKARLTPAQ